MLFPQLDTLEIQTDNLVLNQVRHESSHLFQNQAEPPQSSSIEFSIDSLELEPEIPIGEIIPSIEAVKWQNKGYTNVDIRPRLVDSSTGEARLIDSGAQLSAAMKGPDDKLDNSVRLVAVNGSVIPTYGMKELKVKINRKIFFIFHAKIKSLIFPEH